eukprot:contig_17884_g4387
MGRQGQARARARACRAHLRGRRSKRPCRQRGLLRGVGVASKTNAHTGGSWAQGERGRRRRRRSWHAADAVAGRRAVGSQSATADGVLALA